ncbi:MAG: hypothetical protein JXB62_22765 [Pirellulales bacterium]|nr:hypothetical protein [Pirellulales bacterium]
MLKHDLRNYDWGNGAAAEAHNRMLDHFGADFVQSVKMQEVDDVRM